MRIEDRLDAAELAKLNDDIRNSPTLEAAIDADPTLVDAWKVLDEIGVDQAKRSDPDVLEKFSDDVVDEPDFDDWLIDNPDKFDEWETWENTYNSISDPAKDAMGAGRLSHTQDWDNIIGDLESIGVEVVFREGTMAYSPGLTQGAPGTVIIDPDASISALRHEYRHVLDDQAAGFLGFRGVFDPDYRLTTEFNAYKTEIDFLRSEGIGGGAVDQLKANFEVEVNRFLPDVGELTDPAVADLIQQLRDL